MADRDEWEDPELEPDDEAAHEGENSDDDDISALLDELAEGDPPFENPAVAEGMASSGPPRWFGVRWREIAVEDRVDAWVGLRRWVDWLVAEFALPASVVPPCWFAHPQLVEELYAGMNMEYKAFEEQEPSMNPQMFWLPHLQQMTMRMRMMVENLGGCALGQHRAEPPVKIAYDDALWDEVVFAQTSEVVCPRPEDDEDEYFVRARSGEAVSAVAKVRARTEESASNMTMVGWAPHGARDVRLEAQFRAGSSVQWERGETKNGPWEPLS